MSQLALIRLPFAWPAQSARQENRSPSPCCLGWRRRASVTSPATGVENVAGDLIGCLDECWLWLADVPRDSAGVHAFKHRCIGHGCHEMTPLEFILESTPYKGMIWPL